jgi:hypothetical protein
LKDVKNLKKSSRWQYHSSNSDNKRHRGRPHCDSGAESGRWQAQRMPDSVRARQTFSEQIDREHRASQAERQMLRVRQQTRSFCQIEPQQVYNQTI